MKPALMIASALALAGCVSAHTGFDDAQATLQPRGGLSLPDPDSEDVARARDTALKSTLTPESAAKLAVLSNPGVRAELARLGVAAGALGSARALPNPELTGRAHFHDEGVDFDVDAGLSVTSLVLLGFRDAAASPALDAASWRLAGRALDIGLAARIAFYDSVAARQTLELDRTVAQATRQAATLASELREAGNVRELDAVNEQAFAEESRLLVATSELNDAEAHERLARSLGIFGQDTARIQVPERLPDPPSAEIDLENLESRALRTSLDLAIARKDYESGAGALDLAHVEGWLPDVSLGVGVERDAGSWGVGPAVGLRLPLFYQGQGEALAAESRMRLARSTHDEIAFAVRESARTLASKLRSSRARVEFYQKTLLPLRQRALDETLLQYNAMNAGLFQLLAAKRDQIATARDYVRALHEYWVTRAMVEQLANWRVPSGSPALVSSEGPRGPGSAVTEH